MSRRRRVQPNVSDRSEQPRARHRRSSRIAPILSAIGVITALTSVATVADCHHRGERGYRSGCCDTGDAGRAASADRGVHGEFREQCLDVTDSADESTSVRRATHTRADPAWLTNCNGVIVVPNSPDSDRGQSGCRLLVDYSAVRQLAYAAGVARVQLIPPPTTLSRPSPRGTRARTKSSSRRSTPYRSWHRTDSSRSRSPPQRRAAPRITLCSSSIF